MQIAMNIQRKKNTFVSSGKLLQEEQKLQEIDRLLSGVACGSKDDLAALYHCTRTAVYSLALSYLKNCHDAQDVTQDTYIQIWNHAGQYRSKNCPMSWILTICRNQVLMKIRKDKRNIYLNEEEWAEIPLEGISLTPEDSVILKNALSVLTEAERHIVILHAVTGLKHREIAGILKLPLSTVLSKYNRALKKMKNSLEGDDTL